MHFWPFRAIIKCPKYGLGLRTNSQGAVKGDPDINTGWDFIAEMHYIDPYEHFQKCCRVRNVEQFF